MTTTPADRIAQVLGDHHAIGFGKCNCGWTTQTLLGRSWREKHDAHQADAIAALPDIAVVVLPKPDESGDWCSGRSRNAVWINEDGLIEDRFGLGQEPADVHAWAADLLAAARVAEGGQ